MRKDVPKRRAGVRERAARLRARTRMPGVAAFLIFFGTLASSPNAGPLSITDWGVQGGFSSRPAQFVAGVHTRLKDPAQNVRLVPNADVGLGDHWAYLTLDVDLTYALSFRGAGRLYFGGAAGILYWRTDRDEWYSESQRRIFQVNGYGTDLGAAGVMGWEIPAGRNSAFAETRLGITNQYPDVRIMAGYSVRR
jgi:hypothetical protein